MSIHFLDLNALLFIIHTFDNEIGRTILDINEFETTSTSQPTKKVLRMENDFPELDYVHQEPKEGNSRYFLFIIV